MIFEDQSLVVAYSYSLSHLGRHFERTRVNGKVLSIRPNEAVVRKNALSSVGMTVESFQSALRELEELRLVQVVDEEACFLVFFPHISIARQAGPSIEGDFSAANPITFNDFGPRYIDHLSRNDFAEKTIENAQRVIKLFGSYKGQSLLTSFTPLDLEHYKEHRKAQRKLGKPLSGTTINMDIKALKAMLELAIVWGYLKENPFRPVKPIRLDRKLPRFLTKLEFSQVISLVERTDLRNVFEFGVLTGARRGEVLNLQWKDVDFDQSEITIQSSEYYRVKHGKSRIVPMSTSVGNILKSIEPEDPFVFYDSSGKQFEEDYVTRQFKTYSRAAGLSEDVKFHTLRATFASWMAAAGATPFQIKELLGHAYVKTTEHYTRIPSYELRNIVENLTPTWR